MDRTCTAAVCEEEETVLSIGAAMKNRVYDNKRRAAARVWRVWRKRYAEREKVQTAGGEASVCKDHGLIARFPRHRGLEIATTIAARFTAVATHFDRVDTRLPSAEEML